MGFPFPESQAQVLSICLETVFCTGPSCSFRSRYFFLNPPQPDCEQKGRNEQRPPESSPSPSQGHPTLFHCCQPWTPISQPAGASQHSRKASQPWLSPPLPPREGSSHSCSWIDMMTTQIAVCPLEPELPSSRLQKPRRSCLAIRSELSNSGQ